MSLFFENVGFVILFSFLLLIAYVYKTGTQYYFERDLNDHNLSAVITQSLSICSLYIFNLVQFKVDNAEMPKSTDIKVPYLYGETDAFPLRQKETG